MLVTKKTIKKAMYSLIKKLDLNLGKQKLNLNGISYEMSHQSGHNISSWSLETISTSD